jgi:hypothetical protein
MDLLLVIGGSALLAHAVLCQLLQRRLRDRSDLLQALFAIPNEAILKDSSFRLLKARYYLSLHMLPEEVRSLDHTSRTILTLARLTGLLMPVCLLTFLGMSVQEALT